MISRPVQQAAIALAATTAMLGVVGLLVWFLEDWVGVPNASSVFLLAVVASAGRFGTRMAIVGAIGSFLAYDIFFVEPRFTVTVSDPGEWLNLVLLLVIGIVVGQLAAAQRDRAEAAGAREREAIALFQVGRALATRASTADVLPELATILRTEAGMDRVRITLASAAGLERTAVDTTGPPLDLGFRTGVDASLGPQPAVPPPPLSGEGPAVEGEPHPLATADRHEGHEGRAWTPPAGHQVLRRTPGDAPAEWVRVHQPTVTAASAGGIGRTGRAAAAGGGGPPADGGHGGPPAAATRTIATAATPMSGSDPTATFRVAIEAGERRLGSIWAVRPKRDGPPDQTHTRLLSAAADQIGQALEQDRLGREAREMEIARRSDALKTALLESVSHDLRTPLTSIRAAAGTLLDREVPLERDAQEATAQAIDREAEHLNRLVTNLLDLSRIEAGELHANPEPFDLAEIVGQTVERLGPRLADREVETGIPDDLPPILVDAVFFDQVLTNLLENAVKYTGPRARIRVVATADGGTGADGPEGRGRQHGTIRLTVEDDGAGVPDEAIGRLFEKFYRVRRRGEPSRPGSGIGLTVTRGLIEAMGGRVRASRGELGGLAVTMILPSVARPAEPDVSA